MARTGRLSFTKQFEDPAQHGAVTVKELRALIALPEVRLRGLADAGYAGEQQPAVARGDERGVQDHGVPLQQQGLEGNVGEAVGRLGEKAPVGLQIFDGLAPVWLQMADSIGPVALTPVVEDAKKAVLRSEDGKGIISQKLAAADLGQSLHGQQRDSQGCFAGRTEEGLEAARDLRPERHQQADLTACDGERDRFHRR